jgi:uncharacterized protein (DUF362 family)
MAKPILKRRAFIRLALLSGIGAGLVYVQRKTADLGTLNFLRWMLRGQLRRVSPAAIVALGKCPSYDEDILSYIRNLWQLADMPDVYGKSILVKPNLLDQVEDYPVTTDPRVVGAVLDLLAELGVNKIVVGEGSAFRRDTYSLVTSSGLAQELDKRGIPFVDLNYDELVPVKARDGWIRKTNKLWLPKHVRDADLIISVPKLKAHHWAGVTLSIKNLLGVIPGSRYGWPKNIIHMNGINATILGLYQSLPPVVSVVDGIIGMEGNGPLFGKPVEHGLLAVGRDPVAVDTTCTQLMGYSVDTISYLSVAAWAGIGQATRIETRGISPEQLQKHYEQPPSL